MNIKYKQRRKRKNTYNRYSKRNKKDTGTDNTITYPVQDQFASRARRGDLFSLDFFGLLPDPDEILRRKGLGVEALKSYMSDDQVETVWGKRIDAVTKNPLLFKPGGSEKKDIMAFEAWEEDRKNLKITDINEQLLTYSAYGFKPAEMMWGSDGSKWHLLDIIGLPVHWFAFNSNNELVFKTQSGNEPVNPDKFIILQHRAEYENPYGEKLFSKILWPVTFKRSGLQWFTIFVEKYAAVFLKGKYPRGSSRSYKEELLDALGKMVVDAITICSDDADIETLEAKGKGSSAIVYEKFLTRCDRAISKVILHETLTTESPEKGTQALGKEHAKNSEAVTLKDSNKIIEAWKKPAMLHARYNYGDAKPVIPYFPNYNLNNDKAKRDKTLFNMGVRFKKDYFTENYDINPDHIEVVDLDKLKEAKQKKFEKQKRLDEMRLFFDQDKESVKKKSSKNIKKING